MKKKQLEEGGGVGESYLLTLSMLVVIVIIIFNVCPMSTDLFFFLVQVI